MLTVCTIVETRTHGQAAVMAGSVREHHPDARVVATSRLGTTTLRDAPHALYEPLEGCPTETVAELLARLLEESELVAYLDPTICVYASLEPILEVARRHGVALVPRVGLLPDDGQQPDHSDLLDAGAISPGFVAVTRDRASRSFLTWWARRQRENPQADGRWLDLAAARLGSGPVVADRGANVSYWNLHERHLMREGESILVDGSPLRFVDFGGFRPDRPYWLSEAANRVRVVDDPILAELCGEYADRVRTAGWTPPRRPIAGVVRLGNGQRVDHLVRALWDEAYAGGQDFADPLSGVDADAFTAWMGAPGESGAAAGVNRYLLAAYRSRPDLQDAFPDLDGLDGERLIEWAWVHGRHEVLGELLPSPNGLGQPVGYEQVAVNVIGYLGETLGLAEAARLYIAALHAGRVPVSTTAVTPDLPVKTEDTAITRTGSSEYTDIRHSIPPAFNLACLNGDHLDELIRVRGEGILGGRPTIGQWGWETDVLPPSWLGAFRYVEEIWVYSSFMAENLGRLAPVPVVVVPPAIVEPVKDGGQLQLARDDRFTFLFMIDFFSTLSRKNPLGLIEAFRRAFTPDEGPRLLIKSINARFRPEADDELRSRAADRPDIEIVDLYLKPADKAVLLERADCYVSLHRSEGFGLPLAESMALGTPVIATAYSGNTDFMTSFNSYLVDWSPTRVGSDSEIYPPEGVWAEPDLDAAANAMRRVWVQPEEAAAKARRAQRDIHRLYAPEVAGRIARSRLERLADSFAVRNAPQDELAAVDLEQLQQAIAFDLREGVGPTQHGAAGVLRKLILRAMLPFTFHERNVDRAVLVALRDLRAGLEGERQQRLRDRRDLRRIEAELSESRRAAARPSGDIEPFEQG